MKSKGPSGHPPCSRHGFKAACHPGSGVGKKAGCEEHQKEDKRRVSLLVLMIEWRCLGDGIEMMALASVRCGSCCVGGRSRGSRFSWEDGGLETRD